MIFITLYLKNIRDKGFTILRDDTKVETVFLSKEMFNETLSIILPDISVTAVNQIVDEVISRGSKQIKADKTIVDGLIVWNYLSPTDTHTGGVITNTQNFTVKAKAFFQGTNGRYYIMSVDADGVPRWVVDDPAKYTNVFIFEQPNSPLPNQHGI